MKRKSSKSSYMKMRRLAILAMLLGSYVSWAAAPVRAEHILAVTVPSDYSNSQMGVVYGSRVTTDINFAPGVGIIKNLNRDPATYTYMNHKGKSGFALRQYTYSTTDLKNTEIYTIDHTNLVKEYDGVLANVANMHGCGSNDDYFINTGYDLGRVAISRYDGNKLIEVNKDNPTDLIVDIRKNASEALEGFNDQTQAHGEGVLVKGDNVYVLANINPNGHWDTYLDGFVVHYKIESGGNLKYKSYGRVGKNTDSGRLNLYNNKIFVSSIGGMQNYGWANTLPGSHTAIHAISLDSKGNLECQSNADKNEVVLPANATWMNNNPNASDFHDMKVLPDGTAYIYGYFLNPSSAGSTSHIYKTTVSNLLSKNPENWEEIKSGPIDGWFGKVYAEYYTKRLWLEYGNDLLVYTDGASEPTKSWEAKDFSTNKAYYQFNSATVLDADTVTGGKCPLYVSKPFGMGTYTLQIPQKIENLDAVPKKATYTNKITGTSADSSYLNATSDYSNYTFTKDTVIRPPLTVKVDGVRIPVVGDLKTNVMACVDGHAGNDVIIKAGQNKLWLHAKNYVGNPTGIYAGNGKNVTVEAGTVNIITSGYEGGNTLTNAIWNDAPVTGSSNIIINAPVNICMSGGYGGNGIAVAKTYRWGEKSYEAAAPSKITVNGDVKIAGEDTQTWGIPLNEENVFSRFNNAGLLTSVKHGEININGKVDLSVYGNGAAVNAEDSKINIGSGTIVVPKDMKYGYYSLAAYQGTINMNTGNRNAGDVKLDGDIFVLKTGTVNANLITQNSYLNGLVDNGGTMNFQLKNGA